MTTSIGVNDNCYLAVNAMLAMQALMLVCLNGKKRVTGLIRASDVIFATLFDPKGATAVRTMRSIKGSSFKYVKPEDGPKKRLKMMKDYGVESFRVSRI